LKTLQTIVTGIVWTIFRKTLLFWMSENDFFRLLEEKKLSISEDRFIQKKWYGGEYRMIITSFEN